MCHCFWMQAWNSDLSLSIQCLTKLPRTRCSYLEFRRIRMKNSCNGIYFIFRVNEYLSLCLVWHVECFNVFFYPQACFLSDNRCTKLTKKQWKTFSSGLIQEKKTNRLQKKLCVFMGKISSIPIHLSFNYCADQYSIFKFIYVLIHLCVGPNSPQPQAILQNLWILN